MFVVVIKGGHFILGRRHLVVLGFGGNAHFPEFDVEVLHVIRYPVFDGAEILVFKLLSLGRRRAEDRPSGEHQIDTLQVEFLIHKKVFLFGANGGSYFVEVVLPNAFRTLQGLLSIRPSWTAAGVSSCRGLRRSRNKMPWES